MAVVQRSDGTGPTELRLNINTNSFNGVFVSCGEEVAVLAEAIAEDGVPFYSVAYGKRKGWLKQEHCKQP